MGRAWMWTRLYLDLKIHVRSFDSLHVILRINLLMIGDLHCWVGLYSVHKKQTFDLYIKCFKESYSVPLDFRFFPHLSNKEVRLHCLWECKLIQPLWRTVWRFLKKLNIELPYDPAIPLLGIYLEKTIIRKDACTPVFIAALFTIA